MQEIEETQVQSLSQEDPLEKEMATHSSILAQKIPWTEEPGGLAHGVAESRTRRSDLAHYMPSIQLIHISGIFLNKPTRNWGSQTF